MKAKQRNRPVTALDVSDISQARYYLQSARDLLRLSGAHNAANYVARALKSAQGALSNAQRMLAKQEREAAHARSRVSHYQGEAK